MSCWSEPWDTIRSLHLPLVYHVNFSAPLPCRTRMCQRRQINMYLDSNVPNGKQKALLLSLPWASGYPVMGTGQEGRRAEDGFACRCYSSLQFFFFF